MSATVMEASCEPINDRRVNMVGRPAVTTSGSNLTTMLPSKNKLSNVYIKLSVKERGRERERKQQQQQHEGGDELVDQKTKREFPIHILLPVLVGSLKGNSPKELTPLPVSKTRTVSEGSESEFK